MQCFEKRCWTEISLETIKNNYRVYKETLSAERSIMAVVKADAYGHGDVEVAKALYETGCDRFAVSNIQEALNVRKAAPYAEILVLGYTPPSFFDKVYAEGITQAVLSEEYAEILVSSGKPIRCHFAIDTGMHRIGLNADDPARCAETVRTYSDKLDVTGIFTHLCAADSDEEGDRVYTQKQISAFRSVADALDDLNLPEVHCLNTAGGLWYNSYGDTVRLGISLYGLKPDYTNVLPEGIRPALEWKSVVSMVKTVEAGKDIGYGRAFHTDHPMKIATIPTGYADGYSRKLSNSGYVLIHGKRAPIVGRICMDQMMVDVSEITGVCIGDLVTLLGSDGDEIYTADDMANKIGTIGYEIVCCISKRVERIYI